MSEKNPKGKKPFKSYSEQDQWDDDLDVPPIDYQEASKKIPILEKVEFDKKKRSPLRFVFFIICIPLALALSVLFYQSKEKNTTILEEKSEKQSKENSYVEEKRKIIIETQLEAEGPSEIQTEDTVTVKKVLSNELLTRDLLEIKVPQNYHIVVGSFQNEKNAIKWLEKTSSKKHLSSCIRLHEGWHRAILQSFTSVAQAEIEIDSVRNNLNLKAWIAYMK